MTANTEKVAIQTDTYICPSCGGQMVFDIKKQKFICSSCKQEGDINALASTVNEYDFSEYLKREAATTPFEGQATVSCQNCGEEIVFAKYQVSSVCPKCSSTQIATVIQNSALLPDGIVPFKIDKQGAQEKFRQWAKSRWFAPNDFKKSFGEGGLKGMYLPFWTYDAFVTSHYTGFGGRVTVTRDKDGNTKTHTSWYPTAGTVTHSFDDIQVCASDKEKLIHKVLPYRTTSNSLPYSPQYLSGYYAETYAIKADKGFEQAKTIIDRTMKGLAEDQIRQRFDSANVTTINSKYANLKYKHVLLPLWASIFGYKSKKYGYIINGETGTVSGERPYSTAKIAAAAVAAIIFLVLFFYATGGGSEYSIETGSSMEYTQEVSITDNEPS